VSTPKRVQKEAKQNTTTRRLQSRRRPNANSDKEQPEKEQFEKEMPEKEKHDNKQPEKEKPVKEKPIKEQSHCRIESPPADVATPPRHRRKKAESTHVINHVPLSPDIDNIHVPVTPIRTGRRKRLENPEISTPDRQGIKNIVEQHHNHEASPHEQTVIVDDHRTQEANTVDSHRAETTNMVVENVFPPARLMTCDEMREGIPNFEIALEDISSVLDSALDLPMPSECDMLCRLYAGLEQAWRERRTRHHPLLLTYSEGVQSLSRHVERLTYCNFKQIHVRKLCWIAPHLMTLTWKEKPKYDVHGPEPDRWDLELAPIGSQSRSLNSVCI